MLGMFFIITVENISNFSHLPTTASKINNRRSEQNYDDDCQQRNPLLLAMINFAHKKIDEAHIAPILKKDE